MNAGDRVPADLLMLNSDNEQGTLFIKTDQLYCQTHWKFRKAVQNHSKLHEK